MSKQWVKVTDEFPSWDDTGHIEAQMRSGEIATGWLMGYDSEDGSPPIFEFEIDGGGFGVVADIAEFRPVR